MNCPNGIRTNLLMRW